MDTPLNKVVRDWRQRCLDRLDSGAHGAVLFVEFRSGHVSTTAEEKKNDRCHTPSFARKRIRIVTAYFATSVGPNARKRIRIVIGMLRHVGWAEC